MLTHIRVCHSTHLQQRLHPCMPQKASADRPQPLRQQGPRRSWPKLQAHPLPQRPPCCVQHPHTYASRVMFQKLVIVTFSIKPKSNPCIVQRCISCGKWNCVQIPSKKGQQVRTAKNSSLKKSLPPLTVLSHGGSPPRMGWGALWATGRSHAFLPRLSCVTMVCYQHFAFRVPFAPGAWSTLQSDAGSLTPPVR